MFDFNSLTKKEIIITLIVVALIVIGLRSRGQHRQNMYEHEPFACPMKETPLQKKIRNSIKKELSKRSHCWQDPRVSCGGCPT